MDAGTIVAIIFGVINVGLSAFLFFRKEGKEAAQRRENELNEKLKLCEDDKQKLREDYHELERKCDRMEAKQETFEALTTLVQVAPRPGGQRAYDKTRK